MKRVMWCVAGLTLPAAALGQEMPAAEALPGDIVVSARKRAEATGDIPASIQVLSADELDRRHVRSLDELGQQLPNTVLNRRQDNEPNVVMRGIGAFGNVQGIGFYLDDVQNFTDQSAAIADVERIEVLAGPQGTLYGGSNLGGAIRYVLRRPGDRLATEASAGYGAFDTVEAFGAIDVPVARGLAARVVGHARRTDGYVANTTAGGRADRTREDGGRVALSWSPDPRASVLVQLRHNVLSNGGNIYVRVPDADTYRREVGYNERAFNDRTVTGGSARGEVGIGGASLTVIGSYAQRSTRFLWDVDYSAADAVTLTSGDRRTTRVTTQEARLASSGDRPLDWLVGAYLSEVVDRVPGLNTDLLLGPLAGGPLVIEDYTRGSTNERQYALFGTAGYDRGQWRLELGARLNRAVFGGSVDAGSGLRTTVASTSLLPRASISYDVGRALFYASLASGAEPGKVNIVSAGGSRYDAERATSVEVGAKGTLADGRARYALTLFYTEDRRRQLETLLLDGAGVLSEATANIGRSVSYGAEATLNARMGDRLDLALAAGWLRARWADRNARFDLLPVDGLRIPNAPAASVSIGGGYRQPLGSALALRLSADGRYTGRFAWDVLNRAFQSPYAIVNAGLTLEPRDGGRWSLTVRVENAGGARYFNEFVPDLFGPAQSLGAPGRPRSAMATLAIFQR